MVANFSLFGGDVAAFAGRLADLPTDRITTEVLLDSVIARISSEQIDVVVLDDLHWGIRKALSSSRGSWTLCRHGRSSSY